MTQNRWKKYQFEPKDISDRLKLTYIETQDSAAGRIIFFGLAMSRLSSTFGLKSQIPSKHKS